MPLELYSLKNSISALEKGIASYHRLYKIDTITSDDINTIKSGVIQNFEVAYEQSWKFMKRWIEQNVGEEIVSGVPRMELFRIAAENNLINDIETWMIFHRARNLTSHTYNLQDAEKAFTVALSFLEQAKTFFQFLEKHNG